MADDKLKSDKSGEINNDVLEIRPKTKSFADVKATKSLLTLQFPNFPLSKKSTAAAADLKIDDKSSIQSIKSYIPSGCTLGSAFPIKKSFFDFMPLCKSFTRSAESLEAVGKLKLPDATYDFTTDDLKDLGEIGRGAYGTVNKMIHKQSGTVMAVKRLRSTIDVKEQKQLVMDLDVIMKISPKGTLCLVQFFGALFKEGDCWMCMELMDMSVDKFYKFIYDTKKSRIPESILGKITVAMLTALNYLKEELQIIHRDVKPSNILLNRQGHIKLCDFGIAGKLVDSIARTKDAGCRPYMAPERIDPYRTSGFDVRSDVWSLGITLMEIATGIFPYPKWSSVFEQLHRVVKEDAPRLSTNFNNLDFTEEFVNFVNTCLIKEEKYRPKYRTLLEHDFFVRSQHQDVNVATYVSENINDMQKHGITEFTTNQQY